MYLLLHVKKKKHAYNLNLKKLVGSCHLHVSFLPMQPSYFIVVMHHTHHAASPHGQF